MAGICVDGPDSLSLQGDELGCGAQCFWWSGNTVLAGTSVLDLFSHEWKRRCGNPMFPSLAATLQQE